MFANLLVLFCCKMCFQKRCRCVGLLANWQMVLHQVVCTWWPTAHYLCMNYKHLSARIRRIRCDVRFFLVHSHAFGLWVLSTRYLFTWRSCLMSRKKKKRRKVGSEEATVSRKVYGKCCCCRCTSMTGYTQGIVEKTPSPTYPYGISPCI